MIGVAVYLVIGFVLFVPLGFLVGFIQHKNQQEREREDSEQHRPTPSERNDR